MSATVLPSKAYTNLCMINVIIICWRLSQFALKKIIQKKMSIKPTITMPNAVELLNYIPQTFCNLESVE